MDSRLAKITKEEITSYILPFLPKNKRGFSSKMDPVMIIQGIIHKLKTGVQWHCLFIEIEGLKPDFSWQLVCYYYRRWYNLDIFEEMFKTILEV